MIIHDCAVCSIVNSELSQNNEHCPSAEVDADNNHLTDHVLRSDINCNMWVCIAFPGEVGREETASLVSCFFERVTIPTDDCLVLLCSKRISVCCSWCVLSLSQPKHFLVSLEYLYA